MPEMVPQSQTFCIISKVRLDIPTVSNLNTWFSMVSRFYCETFHKKELPSYQDCAASPQPGF